jgi:hypothetical protein
MPIVCACYLPAPGCTTYFSSGFGNPLSYVDHPGGGLGAPGVGADGGPPLGPPSTPAEFFRGTCLGWGAEFHNPMTTPSGRKVCGMEQKERKIIPKRVDISFRCNA